MNSVHELTKQERVVLTFVAKGWRNARIASELYISPRTVETHLYHIFDKLGVSTRTEAALYVLSANGQSSPEIRGIYDDADGDKIYASA